jgi:DNA-binding NtrC family response regulator
MVVDDEPDVLESIQRSLRRWDLESDGFTDAAIALEVFRRQPDRYVLLLTDLKMDRMSGFELIQQVLAIKPNIKVIVLSAFFRDTLEIPKALKKVLGGKDAILEKPVGLEEICMHVRRRLAIA